MIKKNLLVIGDLILDHTLFVGKELQPSVPDEKRLPVEQRQNTAGGAATTARIISLLNRGKTYLWGISGSSRWGSFRKILEDSQILDGVAQEHRIELLGINAEADAPITTITRLLQRKNDDELVRMLRFDDPLDVHVSDDAALFSLDYHLKRIHRPEAPLHGIIINDFEKGCLTDRTIQHVADFANTASIPLFVDPKRGQHKYTDIKATAILPNLIEWCHLVGCPRDDDTWRAGLDDPEVLLQMAARSFRRLGAFHFQVITCDKEGAVIIAPDPDQAHQYAVYRARPANPDETRVQLGCGDVLTGVLAVALAGSKKDRPTTAEILDAFSRANLVVADYRKMTWHRMPERATVELRMATPNPVYPTRLAGVSTSVLMLPKDADVPLRDYATVIPGLYSQDDAYKENIAGLVAALRNNWQPPVRSVILGAPSGSGKSETKVALGSLLEPDGIQVDTGTDLTTIDFNNLGRFFATRSNEKRAGCNKLLFVIDECLKAHTQLLAAHGVLLLETAPTFGVRFLFIDADFQNRVAQQGDLDSQFFSRCDAFFYTGLRERPKDAPVLVAASVKKCADRVHIAVVTVHRCALLAFLDYVLLERHNARDLDPYVATAFGCAYKEWNRKAPLKIMLTHIPRAARREDHAFEIEPTWFNIRV